MRVMQALTVGIALITTASPVFCEPEIQDAVLAKLEQKLFPTVGHLHANMAATPIRAMLARRERRVAECREAVECQIGALQWTDDEIALISDLAANQTTGTPSDIRASVRRELAGLNAILRVYGTGATPRYPAIDGPAAAGTADLKVDVDTALSAAEIIKNEAAAHFDKSIAVVLTLLDGADRLDAIAFDPLAKRENADATVRAATMAWSRYPFTAIIVLGVGPEEPGVPLSARSKLNVHLAAERYRARLAPFIIVSGAAVHPRGTRFVEAVEMRRALIERYEIPPDAIVLEPYARHTTTNLRNASRLLISLGAPNDRPALIVTNREHSAVIGSQAFIERNTNELGYQAGKIGTRISPNELPFFYDRKSLRVDPADPLDP